MTRPGKLCRARLEISALPSIQGLVRFIRTNRLDFSEVPTPIQNIAVLKEVSDGQRRWDYHVSS